MAAKAGNEFWKQRSKHGRTKLFATPALMWEAACNYFAWSEDNPLMAVGYSGGKRVRIPKMRPFTIHALCLYLNCNTRYFNTFERKLNLSNAVDQEFSDVVQRIRETIYVQQFKGAAAGLLNPGFIIRSLGLSNRRATKPAQPPTQIRQGGAHSFTLEQLTVMREAVKEAA